MGMAMLPIAEVGTLGQRRTWSAARWRRFWHAMKAAAVIVSCKRVLRVPESRSVLLRLTSVCGPLRLLTRTNRDWKDSPRRSRIVKDARRETLLSTSHAKHECWAGG